MAALVYSQFDSDIFGADFWRVVGADADAVAREIAGLNADVALIVDAKLPAGQRDSIAKFQALGFCKAAVMIELVQPAPRDLPAPAMVPKTVAHLTLAPAVLRQHAENFIFQRFRQDPQLPQAASIKLMEIWIKNALAGRRNVVAIRNNFCTYSIADAALTIDLLSCIDRGQGVATQLLTAVMAVARAAGVGQVRVTTEAENVIALRTYIRAGFVPENSTVALHFVRGFAVQNA